MKKSISIILAFLIMSTPIIAGEWSVAAKANPNGAKVVRIGFDFWGKKKQSKPEPHKIPIDWGTKLTAVQAEALGLKPEPAWYENKILWGVIIVGALALVGENNDWFNNNSSTSSSATKTDASQTFSFSNISAGDDLNLTLTLGPVESDESE